MIKVYTGTMFSGKSTRLIEEYPESPKVKEATYRLEILAQRDREEKLMYLGIKKEVCDALLLQIEEEDSESFIRELYSALEGVLSEKEENELPQIIFFIGSTGVGKTTTLAKLTAQYVLEQQKRVVVNCNERSIFEII